MTLFKWLNSSKVVILITLSGVLTIYGSYVTYNWLNLQKVNANQLQVQTSQAEQLKQLQEQITKLESEDPRDVNKQLTDTIAQIKSTYLKSVAVYQDLVDVKILTKDTSKLDQAFAEAINLLANSAFASASAKLDVLDKDIQAQKTKSTAATAVINTATVPVNNTPPSAGYSRQTVKTEVGDFAVSLISGDLGSTRVIVDTASDGDCGNNCPVLPLATYVSRSGAFAGVNGSYFCPASYPDCAGKTNSFDLLVMNKNKVYFNSGNNVYSNNPGVIFGGGNIRFVSAISQWGRDTSVDGVLSNYPLLVSGGNISFGGGSDPKQGSKGNRSFVANKGNTAYIGVVHSASVAEAAYALKALGMENGLNLDDGGSTALWSGGYKVGPGRELPNAILFVRK